MSDAQSPYRPNRRPAGIALTLCALATAPSAQDVDWRTDFDAARAEAREQGKPLLVVLFQAGEPGNEDMLANVYGHTRFARAAGRTVPFIASHFGADDAERVAGAFGTTSEALRLGERAAAKELFPPFDIITPQHIVLHPEGGVLWHNVRVCNLNTLVRGIEKATRDAKASGKIRQRTSLRQALKLADEAQHSVEAYTRLCTLVRQADPVSVWQMLDRLDSHVELSRKLVRDATAGRPASDSRRLLSAERIPSALQPLVTELKREIDQREALRSGRKVARIDGLTYQGTVENFHGARFSDGKDHSPVTDAARLTVLWFYLPEDGDRERQQRMLKPIVDELRAEGVRFLGLGASQDPAADLSAVQEQGYSFPVGTYGYHESAALCGVTVFPAAIVLDAEGNILHRTATDQMSRDYICFAPTVRGILETLDAQ